MNDERPTRGRSEFAGGRDSDGIPRSGSRAPAVVVVFELESAPLVYTCWDDQEDDARLTAWFDSRRDYAAVLHRCVELSEEAA